MKNDIEDIFAEPDNFIAKEENIEDDFYIANADRIIRPFLKWPGGKFRVIDAIKMTFPKDGKRYIEPFVGAGSVSLNVNDYNEIIINDLNKDLINVYLFLQKDVKNFISKCRELFVPSNNTKESYELLRKEFNTIEDEFRKSILFIYLNRHCFNGLCRYNKSGQFNVPIGSYPNPYFPEKELFFAAERIKSFKIMNRDYKNVFEIVEKDDVVYCDPPYMPSSESPAFTAYCPSDSDNSDGFTLQEQINLAKCAYEAAKKGATVIISNHANWYSYQIYKEMFNAKTKILDVARVISSKSSERESVKEVVAIFKPLN